MMLQFDGIDDYVQVADDPILDFGSGDFTLEAWIKRSRTGVREGIVTKKDVSADSEHDLALFIDQDDRAYVFLRETLHGTPAIYLASSVRVGTDWTHLAAVRTGGTVTLYVNGTHEASTTAAYNVSSSGPLRIGANRENNADANASPLFAFDGIIGEVRLWNLARTSAEIRASQYEVVSPDTDGLAAYFRLNDGVGLTASDASGNIGSGTLRNGPIWVAGSPPLVEP